MALMKSVHSNLRLLAVTQMPALGSAFFMSKITDMRTIQGIRTIEADPLFHAQIKNFFGGRQFYFSREVLDAHFQFRL
jgi:hypothetical protein